MSRIQDNQCIINALYAALGDVDKDVIVAAAKDAIDNDTKLDITKLTKKKITTLPKLDRQYYAQGRGKIWRKMSVSSFVKKFPKGTFLVRTVDTAVAVKDGIVIRGEASKRSGIVESFKIG